MNVYLDHDPSFSVVEKLQKQIELEDWVNWGRKEIDYPISLIPAKKMVLTPTAAYLLGRHIFKRGISIMTP